MLGDLVVPDGAKRAHELEDLARRATQYAVRTRGDGTRRAYRSALAATDEGVAEERREGSFS
jgi:hypothetical protein